MRIKDKQVLDKEILHSVMNNAVVCRVGMVKDDRPYIIPLNFGFDGNHIYFHSATSGQKVEILKKNNYVCIEFEQDIKIIEDEKPCGWGARYLTVVVHGTAELLSDLNEKRYGLSQIVKHYKASEEHYQFTDEEIKPVLVYRVSITEIIGKRSG
ncbi:MAG: pyridoxamine 5'-phosphate oxidase family protein [Desulfitobacteriaceae bacterium]